MELIRDFFLKFDSSTQQSSLLMEFPKKNLSQASKSEGSRKVQSYVEVVTQGGFLFKSDSFETFDLSTKVHKVDSLWVKKDWEVLNLDLGNIPVVSRLMAHYYWKEVKFVLEEYFQSRILINPFMADKAMIKVANDLWGQSFDDKWNFYGVFI